MVSTAQAAPLLGRLSHGEGPVWDAGCQVLNYVDISGHRVYRYWPASGVVRSADVGRDACDVHPTTSGKLLCAVREGIALGTLEDGFTLLDAPLESAPDIRNNDGNVDPAGRYYIGTMAFDQRPGAAALYRYEGGRGRVVLGNLTISNGIDWTADGGRMFFVDSPTQLVEVFDYDLATGEFSQRRPFAEIPSDLGIPDGLTVDDADGVWVAVFGGGQVRRYGPDGDLDLIVEVPRVRNVTACAFGGPEMTDLYITTSTLFLSDDEMRRQPNAGRLHRVSLPHRGKPATLYPDQD
ncbi:MAG: SMP-30/gluconolactonase/LRE family protein [Bifidobacteriaceae bacterium]|jgi:sugar lactone lactonase YvrE|nr:SMP-30/gluconolactonase/LRE family protein [Bifidobacteriaceae bacterium]